MSIQEGDKIPAATLPSMQDGKPTPMTTEEIFAGKKVVLFAVPGAFALQGTPQVQHRSGIEG